MLGAPRWVGFTVGGTRRSASTFAVVSWIFPSFDLHHLAKLMLTVTKLKEACPVLLF